MKNLRSDAFRPVALCLIIGATMFSLAGCTPPVGDTDSDNDGIANVDDNCANDANPDQADADNDGIGDACDEDTPGQGDSDGDGVANEDDNCPALANPNQADADGDTVGDACDDCADTPAGASVDADGCPIGTATDSDGDGIANATDDCANTPANEPVDADGCSSSQKDTDDDGVNDNIDQCPTTPADTQVDATGCPVADPNADDADNDGVGDDIDICPNTPAGATVDANGCAPVQLDSDNDTVTDDRDACPGTPAGTAVGDTGCPTGGGGGDNPVCGNNAVEDGEECDPPTPGVCTSTCQLIAQGTMINADACSGAQAISGEGTFEFDNDSATLDGPPHTACVSSQVDQTQDDVWACWTAPCSGTIFATTCGLTGLDTKINVYQGCNCPVTDETLLSCNDDGCAGSSSTQSLTTFTAVQGQQYLIRIGVFPGTNGGLGAVTVSCGVDNCPAGGQCFTSGTGPGCSDQSCCERVCATDAFCCSDQWDSQCAAEAQGICGTGFSACTPRAGSCSDPAGKTTPGCDDIDCCNAVCRQDPFCCLNEWDDKCATREAATCRSSCGEGRGDCAAAHTTPGCESDACCAEVCSRDPICCQDKWDDVCVELANDHCNP